METNNPNMTTPAYTGTAFDYKAFWPRGSIYPIDSSMPVPDTVGVADRTMQNILKHYPQLDKETTQKKEYTGGSVSYYKVDVLHPTTSDVQYTAECNDIIEALGMNYAEGNAFKAIWRSCAARNLGLAKDGYKDGLYDAEKVVFFGKRMVEQAKNV